MKLTLFLFALLAVFSVGWSAVALYPKVEGKPGHCWSELTGPMKDGEEKDIPKQCSSATCGSDGFIQQVTCGLVQGPNGATKTDFSKPYPQCCPQPK